MLVSGACAVLDGGEKLFTRNPRDVIARCARQPPALQELLPPASNQPNWLIDAHGDFRLKHLGELLLMSELRRAVKANWLSRRAGTGQWRLRRGALACGTG